MNNCKYCKADCALRGEENLKECKGHIPMTNADRIRSMSDEEMAWELMTWRLEAVARYHGVESQYPDTQKTILSWLRQPMRSTPTRDGRHAMEE